MTEEEIFEIIIYITQRVEQMSQKIAEGGSVSLVESQKVLNSIDKYIGERIKNRRIILGLTQKELGTAVGVTPQQIQKYESAVNRVASSTLYYFSQFLKSPVDYFFGNRSHIPSEFELAEEHTIFESDTDDEVSERELLKIINAYRSIRNPDVRRRIGSLIEELAIAK